MSGAPGTFIRDGYHIIRGVFSREEIANFRQLRDDAERDWCFVNGSTERPVVVGDLLERYPRAILKVVAHRAILGLADSILGPFVQLDSVVLHTSEPRSPEYYNGVVCWHRDRFGSFPVGTFTRPLAVIVFVYLQDMDLKTGPLRVIPGSHRNPVEIATTELTEPHSQERIVSCSPGDVVVIHNNLLHSGTHNVSEDERRFLGVSYTLSCMGSRHDTFDGPNCRALLETARRMHDRRLMRLLGDDDQILTRQNTGFTTAHTGWDEWREEDQRYAAEASEERRAVADVWGWSP
ncbi:phytanoyl-CoA dioxygenase family protein [Haloechinothrix sp. LS1_15]|uniref:phytanoyl-CoA dioxygenase family protein n=1 Tax=Haloechinothrix sp. LS1_15 TaxID=2652248 RepID=UPI002945F563|nr:phytanoyl-CoA dioxygenase family protein [Haloechinothrix sp. LS1_15]MDV6011205.1 phytanoyl-CoA dioxygenase family protein [Haloechinothrix sp. LS1_15]